MKLSIQETQSVITEGTEALNVCNSKRWISKNVLNINGIRKKFPIP